MAFILSLINEKGGSGKSTIARLLATEFTRDGWDIKIADLDPQGTCVSWALYRTKSKVDPPIAVEAFRNIVDALKHACVHNMIIIDSYGRADRNTFGIAKVSNLILIPTKPTQDDLAPSITLAHELKENGIDPNKILFVLNQTSGQNPILKSRNAIRKSGYQYLKEYLPAKDSYSIAMQDGRSPSEATHPSTKAKAIELYEGISEYIAKIQKENKKMRKLKAKIPQEVDEKKSTFHIPVSSDGQGKIAPPKKHKINMEHLHVKIPAEVKEILQIASIRHKKEMGEIVTEGVQLWMSQQPVE